VHSYRVNFTDPIIHKRTKCHQLQAPRLPGLWHSWLVTGDRQWSRKIAELGPLLGCLSVGRGPPWRTSPPQLAAQSARYAALTNTLILAFATFPELSPFIRHTQPLLLSSGTILSLSLSLSNIVFTTHSFKCHFAVVYIVEPCLCFFSVKNSLSASSRSHGSSSGEESIEARPSKLTA
jgi:hypothetical protein